MAVDVKPDIDVAGVLDKALSGERISDDDARVLLASRELVRIGTRRPRAAQPADASPAG